MPETPHETSAKRIVRRLTGVALGLVFYFAALWCAHVALVEDSRGDWGMHVFWSLGVVLPLGAVWGVRQRSPLSHYLLVRGSLGGALGSIGWIILEVGGGRYGEAGFFWGVLVTAGAVPASLYVWWLATRPPMSHWVHPARGANGVD
ncbi:MAG: hypothetical protein KC619_02830 [Myxococcales bacterium]|nr:hypothetical protein [Myxococcales bacterium]